MTAETACWAVVPAAGVGARMGGPVPKQYLPLAGKPVIAHTLERLGRHPRIRGISLALARHDPWWEQLKLDLNCPLTRVEGGSERCHSVLNGLMGLAGNANDEDWVLVHDAARPCIRGTDITRLMDELTGHPVGGLLGLRVRDTMKRADARGEVLETVSREGLWHALTPQMFRLGALRSALHGVLDQGALVTDEAQAMEWAGGVPRMVEGHADNIKVTEPQDMVLAELYLGRQEELM